MFSPKIFIKNEECPIVIIIINIHHHESHFINNIINLHQQIFLPTHGLCNYIKSCIIGFISYH